MYENGGKNLLAVAGIGPTMTSGTSKQTNTDCCQLTTVNQSKNLSSWCCPKG